MYMYTFKHLSICYRRCHLIQARPGTMLSDALMNSPVMVGEDGVPLGVGAGSSGFDLSMDPMAADDPELAMVSARSRENEIVVNSNLFTNQGCSLVQAEHLYTHSNTYFVM